MAPHLVDTIWAFALAIRNNWMAIAAASGVLTIAVSKFGRRFHMSTSWTSLLDNKPFLVMFNVFVPFAIASFLAFNGERTAKLAAVYKVQSASGIVTTREITSGTAYTAEDSDYMLVFDLPESSKFTLDLLPNPPEGRKFEIKNGDAYVDLIIDGNGHLIDGHPYYVLVAPGSAITVTMVGDTWRIT